MAPSRDALERAFLAACDLELEALKPGNVHVHGAGHGMTVDDFRRSARVAAAPLCTPGRPVGERIREAVAATVAAVGCNTNLGILLLAAPMIAAAERAPPGRFRETLAATLAALTVADAEAAYAAIRLASPGGLGRAAAQDVAEAPTVTLREAMALAAARDRIARQYVADYEDVFAIGVARFTASRHEGHDRLWATTLTYLEFLAAFPDSHVVRKFGEAVGEEVRLEAAAWRDEPARHPDLAALLRHDAALKARGINPGTSADLTVASLLAVELRLTL